MQADKTLRRLVAVSVLAAMWLGGTRPAMACLGCGCGGSSASSDLGAAGGAAGMFSMGQRFLLQQGVSLRTVTGSFNEMGAWSPTPVGGTLATLQGNFGLRWFPTAESSLGVTLPVVGNALDKAAWGPYGSISPTDTPMAIGGALGDVSVQGSYKVWEGGPLALGTWLGAVLPTGNAAGEAPALTGSGLWSAQAGLTGIGQWGDWEVVSSIGGQLPMGAAAQGIFALGPAALYQVQADWLPADGWRIGLGLSGYVGKASLGTAQTDQLTAKFKLSPSVACQWSWTQGVRVAVGIDPMTLGANSMTDASLQVVLFQFL